METNKLIPDFSEDTFESPVTDHAKDKPKEEISVGIDHILPDTASDEEKWTITTYKKGSGTLYYASIAREVYEVIKYLQSEIAAKKLLKEESDPGYEYEIFIDDKGSPFEINDWIPIANEMIKDITKIDEYIKKGLLRRMKVSK